MKENYVEHIDRTDNNKVKEKNKFILACKNDIM